MTNHVITPKGYRWVFCRYMRLANSDVFLDGYDCGNETWRYLVPCK